MSTTAVALLVACAGLLVYDQYLGPAQQRRAAHHRRRRRRGAQRRGAGVRRRAGGRRDAAVAARRPGRDAGLPAAARRHRAGSLRARPDRAGVPGRRRSHRHRGRAGRAGPAGPDALDAAPARWPSRSASIRSPPGCATGCGSSPRCSSLAGSVAFLLSRRLQGVIAGPILDLARTAQQVSTERAYDLRATRHGDDELGQLVDRFNDMLAEIEARDAQLRGHRDRLESAVADRTAELLGVNRDLTEARDRAEAAEPRQERVPRQHEPRDSDADERRPRHDRAGAADAARRPTSARASPPPTTAPRRCST